MLYPPMSELLKHIPSRYLLVNVVARRAARIAIEAEAQWHCPGGQTRHAGHSRGGQRRTDSQFERRIHQVTGTGFPGAFPVPGPGGHMGPPCRPGGKEDEEREVLSLIAKIAVSAAVYAIDKPYSYVVPPGMTLLPGVRVMVPFGRGNRSTEGMVLSLEEGDEAELKCVDRALDPEPVLDDAMLRLAAFVRERYFCTFYAALRAALPVGLWYQVQDTFTLASGKPWEGKTVRQADAQRVLALLEDLGGAGSYSALRKAFTEEEPLQAALRYLLRKKWITTQSDFLRRAGDKTERIAVLSACAEEAMDYARRKAKSAPMQAALLELLCSLGSCTVKELCYYTGATAAVVRRLEKLGYLSLQDRPVLRCGRLFRRSRRGH